MTTAPTYRVVIEHELIAAPIRRSTHEGVKGLEEAITLSRADAPIDFADTGERRAELAVTGHTAWSYGFVNVTIAREADDNPA